MGKFLAALSALRYGSSLSDPAVWKNRQNRLNALVGLLGALAVFMPMFGIHVEVSNEDVLKIAGGVAALIGLFVNPYLTTATSEKVGLPASAPATGEPGADEGSGGGS